MIIIFAIFHCFGKYPWRKETRKRWVMIFNDKLLEKSQKLLVWSIIVYFLWKLISYTNELKCHQTTFPLDFWKMWRCFCSKKALNPINKMKETQASPKKTKENTKEWKILFFFFVLTQKRKLIFIATERVEKSLFMKTNKEQQAPKLHSAKRELTVKWSSDCSWFERKFGGIAMQKTITTEFQTLSLFWWIVCEREFGSSHSWNLTKKVKEKKQWVIFFVVSSFDFCFSITLLLDGLWISLLWSWSGEWCFFLNNHKTQSILCWISWQISSGLTLFSHLVLWWNGLWLGVWQTFATSKKEITSNFKQFKTLWQVNNHSTPTTHSIEKSLFFDLAENDPIQQLQDQLDEIQEKQKATGGDSEENAWTNQRTWGRTKGKRRETWSPVLSQHLFACQDDGFQRWGNWNWQFLSKWVVYLSQRQQTKKHNETITWLFAFLVCFVLDLFEEVKAKNVPIYDWSMYSHSCISEA